MLQSVYPAFVRGRGAVGLLILRLVVGAAFMVHGWGKINSPGGMTAWMPAAAPVPGFLQAAAALSEFGGGALLILGLLTPVAAFFLACTMIVAIGMVHLPAGQPFVNPMGGPSYELAAGYLAAVLALLLAGPGKLSLDALLFDRRGRYAPDPVTYRNEAEFGRAPVEQPGAVHARPGDISPRKERNL